MQGFNMGRYIPPASQDPALAGGKVGGFNSQKGHPLGSRFSKAKEGIITIRFEMPFDVWCETCQPEFLIKQGIRFNAQKRKVGNYLSTPIFEFSMRHPPCGGTVSIRTDPENTRYLVTAGGRMKAGAPTTALDRDYGEILTEEERERRRNDAFAHLEGQNEEKVIEKTETIKIKALYKLKDRHWDDPYTANQNLRREFRIGRKEREASAQEKEEISERYGLGFQLLDRTQADADRAAMVEYGAPEESEDMVTRSTLSKPLFQMSVDEQRKPVSLTKAEWKKQESTRTFHQAVVSNTNAKKDPFARTGLDWSAASKGQRSAQSNFVAPAVAGHKRATSPIEPSGVKSAKLVDYGESDDEA